MTNDKNSSLKNKLKKYAPHAVAVVSTVALGVVLYKHKGRLLKLSDENLARLMNGEVGYYQLKDGTKVLVACIDQFKPV